MHYYMIGILLMFATFTGSMQIAKAHVMDCFDQFSNRGVKWVIGMTIFMSVIWPVSLTMIVYLNFRRK